MSTGVMITLIICVTIMIAAVTRNNQKMQDQVDHQQRNDFPTIEDFQKKDGKH